MSPFKPLLSPKTSFRWTEELDHAFQASKNQIVEAIKQGVAIFDVNRRTCLRTDWSKSGIGYYLSQKHCLCSSRSPGCCDDGWKITLAGSRFLSSTEQRYAPVEGEMLAVAWSLEQTKYFTQGCDNLLVVTDHKPLVKLLGDRTLDEIHNTRLFRIKQRTLLWRFEIEHQPGKSNFAADATSRHPVDHNHAAKIDLQTECDQDEASMINAIQTDFENLKAITWQRVRDETQKDSTMTKLMEILEQGFPPKKDFLPPSLAPFWEFRNSLYLCDGVVLYKDRVVVPQSLQFHILDVLHSAHQGVSAMTARAQASIFWPGITRMIQERRANCRTCNQIAPSHPRMPPTAPHIPNTPFESIFADYFEFRGWCYLVIGDRLSGWSEVYRLKSGTQDSSSKGLIMCLRRFFATFGVPQELSSDGGPQFTAGETKDFLRRWGVRQRISSAHHPQSNGRAELAVKATKRLLNDNIGPNGDINTDSFLRAILTFRNTPDPDCRLSPAQILFGRPLRDAMPSVQESCGTFTNPNVHPMWRDAWSSKEEALRTRYARTLETLNEHSRPLAPLRHGDKVFLQNQTGNHPKKWDRSGTVMESRPYDQYLIKVDGTGRLTSRKRLYLRKFEPHSLDIPVPPITVPGQSDTDTHRKNLMQKKDGQVIESPPDKLSSDEPDTSSFGIPSCLTPSADLRPRERSPSFQDSPNEHRLRRSTRVRKPRLVYDPVSGTYVKPLS